MSLLLSCGTVSEGGGVVVDSGERDKGQLVRVQSSHATVVKCMHRLYTPDTLYLQKEIPNMFDVLFLVTLKRYYLIIILWMLHRVQNVLQIMVWC